mmetsp:Transcript_9407/g.15192  ORF Transcript_9407/g.15192 Transcript_9407/m.15192 type:complete len:168 (+) Transcript_9407:85-588(+)
MSFSARGATPRSKFNPARTFDWSQSGMNYLKDSKINSATGYIQVAGTTLAVPHGKRSTTAPAGARRTGATEYAHQFSERPYCYASMGRKPLSPYHQHSHRSRLAIEDPPVPDKNISSIEFDSGLHVIHKRRFITTYENFFQGEALDPRANTGVTSETAKLRHKVQQS